MKIINTTEAPAAIGPYSQAIKVSRWIFTAGQIGIDPETGTLVDGSFEDEVRQVLANLQAVLAAVQCRVEDIVKTTVYLTDLADFALFNEIYGGGVGGHGSAGRSVGAVGTSSRGPSSPRPTTFPACWCPPGACRGQAIRSPARPGRGWRLAATSVPPRTPE